jgi:hypothetical protein
MSTMELPETLRRPGALDIEYMTLITEPTQIEDILNNRHSNAAMYFTQPEVGLGLYRGKTHYLIGLQYAGLHAHERWLYIRPIAKRTRHDKDWYRLHEDLQAVVRDPDPLTLLAGTRYMALGTQSTPKDMEPLTFAATYLAQWYFPNPLEADRMREILTHLWQSPLSAEDRHDLLYHYDVWLQRHPEMADFPKELAQRMHGLGPLLDLQGLLTVPLRALR